MGVILQAGEGHQRAFFLLGQRSLPHFPGGQQEYGAPLQLFCSSLTGLRFLGGTVAEHPFLCGDQKLRLPKPGVGQALGGGAFLIGHRGEQCGPAALLASVPVETLHVRAGFHRLKSHPGLLVVPRLVVFGPNPPVVFVEEHPAFNQALKISGDQQGASWLVEGFLQGPFFSSRHRPHGFAPEKAPAAEFAPEFSLVAPDGLPAADAHSFSAAGVKTFPGAGQFSVEKVQAVPLGKAHAVDMARQQAGAGGGAHGTGCNVFFHWYAP